MPQEPTKTVHFFALMMKTGPRTVRAETIDWSARLQEHLGLDVAERMMKLPTGGRLMTEAVPACPSQVILGKVLDDTDLGLRRGSIAGQFEVVAPKDADEFFMRVNYVQFVEGCNAFALIGGAGGDVPSSSSVEALAEELVPPAKGQHWVAQPIMSEPEIERFTRTGALKSVTTTVTVAPPGFFDPETSLAAERQPDLYSWGQGISAEIGANLRLSFKISIEEPSSHVEAGRRLFALLSRSRERLVPSARKVQAVPLADDEEVINLLRYKLTTSVPLPDPMERLTGEAFQQYMLAELETVSARMKDQIVQATGG